MASRYWVGGTGNYNDTAHWSTTSGGSSGASVPTSTDDVFFDANSGGGTVTLAIAGSCASLSTVGFTGTTTSGAIDLSVYGNVTLGSNLGFYNLNMVGTSSFNITSNGYQLQRITFNSASGTWTLQDDISAVFSVTLTAGILTTNNKNITCQFFQTSGNGSRTLNLGSSTLTINSPYFASEISGTNLTLNAGTSSIVCNTGRGIILGGFTYYNFSYTGYTVKTDSITFTGNATFNSFTVNGNSATNRIFVKSDTIGTSRTITAATVGTCSNVDFMDIIGAGTGSWNLSAISGGSGTCGGNGGITFTSPQIQYWRQTVTGNANWSDVSKWFLATGGTGGAGRVPLPQDTAKFDANSFTVTGCTVVQDMPRIGSVDWSAATNSPIWNNNSSVGGIVSTCFGNFILNSTMNPGYLTLAYNYFNLAGRGNYVFTTAGQTIYSSRFFMKAPGGTYTQQDNALFSGTIFSPLQGNWNANGYNFTTTTFDDSYSDISSPVGQETLTMGSGTWTITGYDSLNSTGTFVFKVSSTATVTSGTSTLVFNNSTVNAKTMYFGGKTYNNVTLSGTGSGSFTYKDTGNIFLGLSRISNTGSASVDIASTSVSFYGGIDLTGFNGTWAYSTNNITAGSILKFSSLMTNSYYGQITFIGNTQLTFNGKVLNGYTVINNGIINFNDDLISSPLITFNAGTFNTNNFNITTVAFQSTSTSTRTINLGTSTLNIGVSWDVSIITGLTLNASNATIKMTTTSANQAFNGGGFTYGTFWNATTGSGSIVMYGNNTFSVMKSDPGRTTAFAYTSTQTLTSASGWQMSGTAGNLTVLKGYTGPAYYWNVVCASGTINADYMSLTGSHASGGAIFNAGLNSINVSYNTGWIFGPTTSNFFFFYQF